MSLKIKEKDLLMGLILGNGKIYKIKDNYKIYIKGEEKYKDYLEWKISLLNNLKFFKKPLQMKSKIIKTKGFNKKCLQYYFENNEKKLKEIYDIFSFYDMNDVLKNIHSDCSLALWIMDKGYIVKKKKKHKFGEEYYLKPTLRLYINNFTNEDSDVIISWFRKRYLINPILFNRMKNNKTYSYIQFNAEETVKIFKIINNYIEQISSMKKKFSFFKEYYQL